MDIIKMKNINNYLKISIFGGITYLFGRYIIFKTGNDFTSAPDWLFRLVLVGFVTLSIILQKKSNQNRITIREGFTAGAITTCFLAMFIAISTWFYCDVVNQKYTEEYKTAYRELHYENMMRAYIYKEWGRDTITQGAMDTVNRGLDLNISNQTATLFTTKGQVVVSLIYTFFWGLAVAITVAMLSQNTNKN